MDMFQFGFKNFLLEYQKSGGGGKTHEFFLINKFHLNIA